MATRRAPVSGWGVSWMAMAGSSRRHAGAAGAGSRAGGGRRAPVWVWGVSWMAMAGSSARHAAAAGTCSRTRGGVRASAGRDLDGHRHAVGHHVVHGRALPGPLHHLAELLLRRVARHAEGD